jgi:hypothetical protein
MISAVGRAQTHPSHYGKNRLRAWILKRIMGVVFSHPTERKNDGEEDA